MPGPFGRISAGDPLRFPAPVYDALLDMLAWWGRQNKTGAPALPMKESSTIVPVRNATSDDLVTGQILAISAPRYDHDANPSQFKFHPSIIGVEPAPASHFGKYVVLRAPIAAGDVGPAVISGVAAAKLYVYDAEHEWADVHPDPSDLEAYTLTSGQCGAARILWKESGTGSVWGLIELYGPELVTRFELSDDGDLAPGGTAYAHPLEHDGSPDTDADRKFQVKDFLGIHRGRAKDKYTTPHDDGSQGYAKRCLDSNLWEILSMQPQALMLQGVTTAAVTGSAFSLTSAHHVMQPVGGIITDHDPADTCSVQNPFAMDIDSGGDVVAAWDEAGGHWDAIQALCPT